MVPNGCLWLAPMARLDAAAGRSRVLAAGRRRRTRWPGSQPCSVARPASTAEARALLAAAAGLDLAGVPRGTGTRLAWGSPPDRCDLVIDTLGWTGCSSTRPATWWPGCRPG